MLIGLTGGIGSGKSTVASGLAERGAMVLDADRIAREVVEPGTPGLAAVVERFGAGMLDATGAIDRAALASVVFADPKARRDLEAIVHPAVGEEIARRVSAAPPGAIIVVDVPLLVEVEARTYDLIVVVEAETATRLARLVDRGMNRADAQARIAAQVSDAQRRTVADVVIDNNGDNAALTAQLDALWNRIQLIAG